jgi:hypothetical protein
MITALSEKLALLLRGSLNITFVEKANSPKGEDAKLPV